MDIEKQNQSTEMDPITELQELKLRFEQGEHDCEHLQAELQRIREELMAVNQRLAESEQRYRGIVENTEEGMALHEPDGTIRYVNQRMADMMGYSPEEIIGRSSLDFLDEAEREAVLQAREGMKERGSFTQERKIRRKDGSILWTLVKVSPRRDEAGNYLGYQAQHTDITGRKRAEEALIRSNQRISQILSSITDDFYVLDHEWKFVYANQQFTGRIGKQPEDFVGNSIWEMFPKHVGNILYENYHASMEQGEIRRFEIRGEYTDSWYSMTCFPSPEGITVLGADITERKRAEEALRVSEEKYRNLFTSMSQGYAICQLIRDEKGTAVDYRYLEVNPAMERLLGLTNVAGKTRNEVFPNRIGTVMPFYARVVETGEPMVRQEYQSVDGLWFDISSFYRGVDQFMVLFDDITERKQAEEALRESEQRLAEELEAARRLQEMSVQLIQVGEIQDLYEKMLDTAVMIAKSDCASLQVVAPGNENHAEVLQLMAWRGFHPQSAQFWQQVNVNNASACEEALRQRQRVIIPEIEESELLAGTPDLEEYWRSGIRAVQSTPLITRSGRAIGMISTHWREPHQPSEGELRTFDILVRQVADLIERKQAEAALQESKEQERLRAAQLEAVYKALPVGFLTTDEQGGINQMNAAFEQVWGGKPPETHSVNDYSAYKGWWMETGKEVAAEEWASAQAVQQGKTVVGQLIKIQRFDGSTGYVFNSASPVWDTQGTIVGSVVAIQDITRLQEAEQALKEANQFLEQRVRERTRELEKSLQNEQVMRQQLIQTEKYAALTRLMASVTHEINNPLQTIQNSLYLLEVDLPPGALHSIIDMAVAESKRMSALVQQLRETYRPADLLRNEFNLIKVLEDVQRLLTPQLRQSNIHLFLHTDQDPIQLYGLPDQIKQVFLNICLNAIDAVGAQGGQIGVEVTRPEAQQKVCISILDSGPGIPPEQMDKLFEPFFTTKEKGTGLGLAISYEIVKNHGGEIGVESELGKGTTFKIILPVKS